jgi:hypothetical protein
MNFENEMFVRLLLQSLAYQAPLYLVWLVAAILALVLWRRHPGVSLLVLLSMALFFGQSLVGSALQAWLSPQRIERGWTNEQLAIRLSLVGGVRVGVQFLAWALLLVALFGWRRVVLPPYRGDPPTEIERPPDTAIQQRRQV